ncbi:HlyD family secretion protein [Bacillus pakistanensis]|uniref:HlyD family secretion protein n=1 Tax=Rossellomorea pakistanensis TaxID=992288 RepID=A0ABS2NBU2_9BACI|nr:HlyD family efflux transporter periplasmic adaptor subunit [Bacillus pakistanensis]MBM7585308.1 HlyD family secretion protein [Bacillus pakistanensis]
MKKKLFYLFLVFCAIFVSINIFLIEKADSKIQRISYIDEWSQAKQKDLKKTIEKQGVVGSSEEHSVYFHEENGIFQKFLVGEGDTVEEGTPLFEYKAENIEEQKVALQAEIDQIEDEINSLEDYISNLEKMKSSVKPTPSLIIDKDTDKEKQSYNTLGIEYSIDQNIYNSELEISRLESRQSNLEEQLSSLSSLSETVTVKSEISGIVKDISKDLGNPIVTISSDTPIVNSNLTEKETTQVKEGLNAKVFTDVQDKSIQGEVLKISPLPEKEVNLDEESLYPIQIKLNDAKQNLMNGYHVSVSIITEEVKDVLALPIEYISKSGDKPYVWVINSSGEIEKRELSLGIKANGQHEIKKGLKLGDTIIEKPYQVSESGSRFITPLDPDVVNKKNMNKVDKPIVLENLLLGILE